MRPEGEEGEEGGGGLRRAWRIWLEEVRNVGKGGEG